MGLKDLMFLLGEEYAQDRARFWSLVDKTPSCWLWMGPRSKKFGTFSVEGGDYMVHRIALMLHSKTCPPHTRVAHRCGHTLCVNPGHLAWTERPEPDAKQVNRGLMKPARRLRLTREQVATLYWTRRLCRLSSSQLAGMFNVSTGTVTDILRRRTYRLETNGLPPLHLKGVPA